MVFIQIGYDHGVEVHEALALWPEGEDAIAGGRFFVFVLFILIMRAFPGAMLRTPANKFFKGIVCFLDRLFHQLFNVDALWHVFLDFSHIA